MKNRIAAFMTAFVLLCCLVIPAALTAGASADGKLTITGSRFVAQGKKITLKANAKKVTWTTSNKKVATVSSKGVVKGVKAGKAVITAKTSDGRKATWKVTVKAKAATKVKIKAPATELDLNGFDSVQLTAKASPSKAAQSFTWSSSDNAVATVSDDGKVTAHKTGTVTITAKATDGSKKKASVKLTVINTPMSTKTTPPEKQTVKWFQTSKETKAYQPYVIIEIPGKARVPHDEDGYFGWHFPFTAREKHGKKFTITKYTIRWFNEDGVAIPDWITEVKSELKNVLGGNVIKPKGQVGGFIGIQYDLPDVKTLTGVGIALTGKDDYGNIYEFRAYSPLNAKK